jgi:esterase/lipase superfamily enzyme
MSLHPLVRHPSVAWALSCFAIWASAAGAAEFDLCVRGTSLDEAHTARLTLTIEGAQLTERAPRLAAEFANLRFWSGRAEEVSGAPFDPEICGAEVADKLTMTIALTPAQAKELTAALEKDDSAGLRAAAARVLGVSAQPRHKDLVAIGPSVGEPVLDAAGKVRYHVMRVYYATNRLATSAAAPEEHFGGDRGNLSFGVVNVALPRTHQTGQLEAPSIFKLEFSADPDKHITLQSLTPLASDAWRAEIAKRAMALERPGILLFVHGYNASFAEAARRAGQLAFDLRFDGATVLFSWPSRNSTLEYTVDEQSAEWSVPDMNAVLASLATVAPGAPIYVIAHSMGNRVFTRGFKDLLEKQPAASLAFKQLVLAAPDVDADVFRREIGPAILGMGPRVTLYASSNDKALAASRGVHGGYRRLGESGKDLVVLKGLDTVDASSVDTEFLGHSYYGDNRTVMSDLMYLIRRSLPPEEREQYALERVRDAVLGLYWRFKHHE